MGQGSCGVWGWQVLWAVGPEDAVGQEMLQGLSPVSAGKGCGCKGQLTPTGVSEL